MRSIDTNYKVILLNSLFVVQAQFDIVLNCSYTNEVNGVGSYNFSIDANDPRQELFTEDSILLIKRRIAGLGIDWYTDFVGLHRSPKFELLESGDYVFTSIGVGPNDFLARTIINYPQATVKSYKNMPPIDAMREFVWENCGEAATVDNGREADGVLPDFFIDSYLSFSASASSSPSTSASSSQSPSQSPSSSFSRSPSASKSPSASLSISPSASLSISPSSSTSPSASQSPSASVSPSSPPTWEGDRAYQNLLEVLKEISLYSSVDFQVELDEINWKWVFRAYPDQLGLDRTVDTLDPSTGANASGNHPTVFSIELGNISTLSYTYDRISESNRVTILGDGDGATRITVLREDTGASSASRWNRREASRPQSGFISDMQSAGDATLKELSAKEIITISPLNQETCMYGIHWKCGDKVSTKFRKITYSRRLISVKNTIGTYEKLSFEFATLPR